MKITTIKQDFNSTSTAGKDTNETTFKGSKLGMEALSVCDSKQQQQQTMNNQKTTTNKQQTTNNNNNNNQVVYCSLSITITTPMVIRGCFRYKQQH